MKQHYVYLHRDKDTDEVVYVGIGQHGRCLNTHKRSADHAAFMNESINKWGLGFVDMPYTGLSERDARELEAVYIRKYKPRFNKQMNGAANAGRGSENHNSRFTEEQVAELRDQWAVYNGSLRSFHRTICPQVSWTTVYKLINGASYA